MCSVRLHFTPSSSSYKELLRINISHNYYKDLICDDFKIEPTPHTAHILESMDIRFIPFKGGVKLAYQDSFKKKFIDYVNLQESSYPRISFKFYLKNHLFLNFTELPIDLDPVNECLYSSNVYYWSEAKQGPFLQTKRLEVLPGEYPTSKYGIDKVYSEIPFDKDNHIEVCLKSVIKNAQTEDTDKNTSTNDKNSSQSEGSDNSYVDMKGEMEGVYFLKSSKEEVKTKIYTGMSGTPFLFFDIFLKCYDKKNGIKPVNHIVENDGGNYTIKPKKYHMKFKSRALYWDYYIVEPANHVKLYTPSINGKNRIDKQNNGSFEYGLGSESDDKKSIVHIFKSQEKLDLKEVSPYEFSLEASRKGGESVNDSKSIIIKRLPVASINQINYRDSKSGKKEPGNICSDIYVYV